MNELHALVIPAGKCCLGSPLSAGRSKLRVSYRRTPRELVGLVSKVKQTGSLATCRTVFILTAYFDVCCF